MHEAAEKFRLHFSSEEDVCADAEVAGQGEILVGRLDSGLARIDRTGEVRPLALKGNFAFVCLINSRDAAICPSGKRYPLKRESRPSRLFRNS
jgi:hypothetical protein